MKSKVASHLSAIKMANSEKKYVSNAGARKFLKRSYSRALRVESRLEIKKFPIIDEAA